MKPLRSLPGIGVSKEKAIIEYRETYGEFSSVAEITNVKGIGNKLKSWKALSTCDEAD